MLVYNGPLAESAVPQPARQAASGTWGGVIAVIAEGRNSLPIFSWLQRARRLKRGRVSAKVLRCEAIFHFELLFFMAYKLPLPPSIPLG